MYTIYFWKLPHVRIILKYVPICRAIFCLGASGAQLVNVWKSGKIANHKTFGKYKQEKNTYTHKLYLLIYYFHELECMWVWEYVDLCICVCVLPIYSSINAYVSTKSCIFFFLCCCSCFCLFLILRDEHQQWN